MFDLIKSESRGKADHGWLKAYHSFSFADYYDEYRMGYSALRVINEDRIAVGGGFPTHGHADMEIVTFVISGALEHKDTLGNRAIIRPGEVKKMSAGTGIRHSEFNPLNDQPTHLLQIWILPDRKGHTPSYEQKSYLDRLEQNQWITLVSGTGEDGSIRINQDARIHLVKLDSGEELEKQVAGNRKYWVQIISGEIKLAQTHLAKGDAVAVEDENLLHFKCFKDSQFLVFDLP